MLRRSVVYLQELCAKVNDSDNASGISALSCLI